MYGLVHLSCIPVRKSPSSTSEMVTQLLYGEVFEVLEENNGWAFIRTHFDHYYGWINRWQAKYDESYPRMPLHIVTSLFTELPAKPPLFLPAGSMLPEPLPGTAVYTALRPEREAIVASAQKFMGVPYLWGGRTFMGIDCSGLAQVVFKINGINLPRDAKDQAMQGKTLSFLEESRAGDLAFFDNEEGRIIHVGILTEDRHIIHAHGEVRLDPIDQLGIYNMQQNRHTHQLRLIKSYL